MTVTAPTDLDDLPWSARFLLHKLNEADEPLTRREIEHECGMPERTANYALARLRDAGLVEPKGDRLPTQNEKPRYGVASQSLRGRHD